MLALPSAQGQAMGFVAHAKSEGVEEAVTLGKIGHMQCEVVDGMDADVCHVASALTGLRSRPTPSISTSQTSPGFMNTGGLRAKPTPAGVPLMMMSPG